MRPSLLHLGLIAILLPILVQAEVYELEPEDIDVVGIYQRVNSQYTDTFTDIGRLHNVGYEELRAANPDIDPWLPGEGTEILLPTKFVLPRGKREGVIVNLAEFRIYYFYKVDNRQLVATVPASIGRMDWATPLGLTRIVAKTEHPSWRPPASVREEYAADGRKLPLVVPPGPDNPLGDYALRLGIPGYLIHGTNRPAGVGMRVTHGCIRLFPEDIAWLFPKVSLETPVRFVNQPVKFGWKGDALYFEVHPELAKAEPGEEGGSEANTKAGMTLITKEYVRATRDIQATVDWELIALTYGEKSGMPVRVGSRTPVADSLALNTEAQD
jgi:L,D-transpeptidase ErfK/SrfK